MTPSWVCTFRTDATNIVDQNWSMHRGSIEIGRLFTRATGDENFHIQASSGDLRFWTREGSFFNTPPDPALDRARLKAKGSIVIGSVINPQPIDGHFGVGPFTGTVSNPYTMFHVDQVGNNAEGYREGMREGMSSSRSEDYGYVGLLDDPYTNDNKDYGIAWSREVSNIGGPPSKLRFIYTGTNGSGSSATTSNGLELGRFNRLRAIPKATSAWAIGRMRELPLQSGWTC